jgi:hypothetical protein
MKRIIDKNTGQLLYATLVEIELQKNEMILEGDYDDNFENPYYDFKTDKFYNKE